MDWLAENGSALLFVVAVFVFMLRHALLARVVGVEQLSVHELSALLASATPPLLLDVRSQPEFDSGHVANAVLVPLPELWQRVEEVRSRSSGGSVAVICLRGNRSVAGAVLLKRAGFAKVFNVIGGTIHWKAQGYPVR